MTFSGKAMRPSFPEIYLRLAQDLAKRSTCQRLQVGTVITTTDFRKVLAVGYNGNASGLANCCDDATAIGSCGCLHSEDNAIINCDCPRDIAKYVFVTHLPCVMCAKRLINLGNVVQVSFINDYRDNSSINIFNQANILVTKINNI